MSYLFLRDQRTGVHRVEGLAPPGAFFDGIGVFGKKLFLTGETPPDDNGRGCFLIARHHADGSVDIVSDPLGMYPVFTYRQDATFCVSNNVYALADALAGIGIHLRRSLQVHGYFITQGSGAFDLTGYEGVTLLPTGTRIHVAPGGNISQFSPALTDLLYSNQTYADLVEEAADEILGNVTALADAPFDDFVCDLSGGMDSRLVLAAVMHAGRKDQFVFHTRGSYPNTDANVAALIRKTFGLKKYAGDNDHETTKASPFARFRHTVGTVGGLLSMDYGVQPSPKRNELSLGGGCGELLRQFWRGTGGVAKMAETKVGLLHRHVVDDQVQRLEDFRKRAMKEGVRGEHVGDLLYLTARSRYHFGVWWAAALRRRYKFHPLCSPAGVKAAHALSLEEQRNNRLGFDLMSKLYPALVSLPFADKAWAPSLGTPVEPVTKDSPFLGEEGPPRSPMRSIGNRASRFPPGTHGRAVKLIDMLLDFQREPRNYASMSAVFDPIEVEPFLDPSTPRSEMQDAWRAYRVLGAYVWANNLETR